MVNDTGSWSAGRGASPPEPWIPASQRPECRPQFDACDRLEGMVMAALREPTGEFNQTANAVVKLAVARALHAFDALLHLADAGYATPAVAVARTLIEETVASWWLRDLPKHELLKRLTAHEQSYALLLQAEDPNVNYLPLLNGLPQMSAEDLEHASRAYGVDANLGMRHWTGKTVKRMAQAVRGSMRPIEKSTLDTLIGKPLLVANLMTHNSPLSMATRLVPPDELDPSVVVGARVSRRPTTRLVHEALALGYESLALIAWLVSDEAEKPQLDAQIQGGRHAFVVIAFGSSPRRNDPCPCGSGMKFKRCHGRPGMTHPSQMSSRDGNQDTEAPWPRPNKSDPLAVNGKTQPSDARVLLRDIGPMSPRGLR